MAIDNDPDQTSQLSQVKDRSDEVAAAQARILETTLKEKGDSMDPDTKAKFTMDLLSLRGQVQSAREREEANRRMGGGTTPKL